MISLQANRLYHPARGLQASQVLIHTNLPLRQVLSRRLHRAINLHPNLPLCQVLSLPMHRAINLRTNLRSDLRPSHPLHQLTLHRRISPVLNHLIARHQCHLNRPLVCPQVSPQTLPVALPRLRPLPLLASIFFILVSPLMLTDARMMEISRLGWIAIPPFGCSPRWKNAVNHILDGICRLAWGLILKSVQRPCGILIG